MSLSTFLNAASDNNLILMNEIWLSTTDYNIKNSVKDAIYESIRQFHTNIYKNFFETRFHEIYGNLYIYNLDDFFITIFKMLIDQQDSESDLLMAYILKSNIFKRNVKIINMIPAYMYAYNYDQLTLCSLFDLEFDNIKHLLSGELDNKNQSNVIFLLSHKNCPDEILLRTVFLAKFDDLDLVVEYISKILTYERFKTAVYSISGIMVGGRVE